MRSRRVAAITGRRRGNPLECVQFNAGQHRQCVASVDIAVSLYKRGRCGTVLGNHSMAHEYMIVWTLRTTSKAPPRLVSQVGQRESHDCQNNT